MKKINFVMICIELLASYCGYWQRSDAQNLSKGKLAMNLKSLSFNQDQTIPEKYTCAGENISPELHWTGAPMGTQSFVLIVDDPDAPIENPFVHWVVYNLSSDVMSLPESAKIGDQLGAIKGKEGKNDFKKNGYDGPCPPKGHGRHRYYFKLYALAIKLDLQIGATKETVMQAMQGHVLQEAELVGTFEIK